MVNFNFHHHNSGITHGIYNCENCETAPVQAFSAGIHPKDIEAGWEKNFDLIKKISLSESCLAIGECGLDSSVNAPQQLQEQVFFAHLSWANSIGKPVIIHCVRRFQETVRLCKGLKQAAVIHGFNKKKALADELLSHGFYLSFGAALLHSLSLQQTFKTVPRERLFLETDAHPADISEIYGKASELLGISPIELEGQISENLKQICNER